MNKIDKKYNLPRFKMKLDDNDTSTGMRFLAMTDDPAIEQMGVCFNNNVKQKEIEFKVVKDRQIIAGPILIPNKDIIRKDKNTGQKYVVYFEPEDVYKIMTRFTKLNTNNALNDNHTNFIVDGYIEQSWIVGDPVYDKSRLYNFNLPKGTWFGEVKIESSKFWRNEVRGNGKFGFSIEGILGEEPVDFSRVNGSTDELMNEFLEYHLKSLTK